MSSSPNAPATELGPDPAPSTLHAVPESETYNPQPVTCNLPPEPEGTEPGARIPEPEPRPQCRAIKTDGTRCNGIVLKGLHLCWSHFHHRHPALADKDHISIPLLEDHASIRLVMTQIVHGLLSMKLDPARAKAAIWAAQVAAHTLPRPARLKGNEPKGEPVHRLGADHDGLISADPDPGSLSSELCALSSPPAPRSEVPGALSPVPGTNLNYLCQVTANAEEVWALQDRTDLGLNQPPPEQRYIDPWHAAPPPQPFPGWNVPPPPPPPPPLAHESGLPCDCPKCKEYDEKFLLRYYGPTKRPRRKSRNSPDDPDFNPLCESNQPRCLGPDSEFCCRKCKRVRKARLAAAPKDDWDEEFTSANEVPEPGARPPPRVTPETQYPASPTE